MTRDSFEALVRLVALAQDPHQLIALVASDESLLREAKRAYDEQKKGLGINLAIELCGSYRIPLDYFQDRLRLVVRLLNLVPPEEDYYWILGVKSTADHDEIKRSFRRLSRVHHPDVNPRDPQAVERFRKVREAYEVLGNSTLRERYDLHVARSPRIDHAPPAKVPKAGWHYRPRLLHFAVLVVLLVIASLLIDYEDLITRRYYRAKYLQVPAPPEDNLSPSVPEMKLAQVPAEKPLPVPDDAAPSKGPEIPDQPQPGLASADTKQTGQIVQEAPIRLEAPPLPQEPAAPPAESAPQKEKPATVRLANQTPPKPESAPQIQERLKAPVPQPSPESTLSTAGPGGLEMKPARAIAAKASDGVVSASDMKQRLQGFLNRYARAYEDKNSTVFFSLFEPDAVENGEPVAGLLPRYRDNFQRLEKIRYSIRLVTWEGSEKGLKVNGSFRLYIKLRGGLPMAATGAMQLDLILRGDDFRINRLVYNYEQSRYEGD